jgi:hypothetical protein
VSETSNRTVRRAIVGGALLATFAFSSVPANAQNTTVKPAIQVAEANPSTFLAAALPPPNAPGPAIVADSALPMSPGVSSSAVIVPAVYLPEASHTQKYIAPGQAAPSLTVGDKALLGMRDAVSPFAASGWFATAGYEQLMNGSPNYGTDRGAFGQRLGAAAIRDASESIFSDSVMSSVLHEDPRYYRLGPEHNFFVRLVYAGTRPLVTRTDGGRISPNLALLSGTLGGAALTNLYYPQVNRGPEETMETFGGSLGGAALGDVVSEFYGDLMHKFHPQTR